jgi:hypothetical protein
LQQINRQTASIDGNEAGRSSAYHSQCNAQAEVANKTITKYLRNEVNTSTLNLEIFLPPFMFCHNTSFHRMIQTLKFFLTFGQNASQPFFDQDKWQDKLIYETHLKKSSKP